MSSFLNHFDRIGGSYHVIFFIYIRAKYFIRQWLPKKKKNIIGDFFYSNQVMVPSQSQIFPESLILFLFKFVFPFNNLDTGFKLKVHKTFRRGLGHLRNVLCTLNLYPVSPGKVPLRLRPEGREVVSWNCDFLGNLPEVNNTMPS